MIGIVSESYPKAVRVVTIESLKITSSTTFETSKSSGVVSDRKQKSNWTCRAYIS